MDVRQLRYFTSVLEHQSFTKAAEALRLAQPALGLQIRKLEDELGVQLLVRHSRGVAPTEAGVYLLERADLILAELEATRQALKNFSKTLNGRITLGMTPSITAMLARPLVRKIADLHPGITLVLAEELNPILAEWLSADRLDLALGYGLLASPRLEGEPVLVEELFLVRSAKNAEPLPAEGAPFASLAGYPLVMPAAPHSLRTLLNTTAEHLGVELNVKFEMNSVHILKELTEDGFGSTILPYGAVRRDCEEGRLVATRIVDPVITRTADLAYSARRPRSRAEVVVCQLLEQLIAESQDSLGFRQPKGAAAFHSPDLSAPIAESTEPTP